MSFVQFCALEILRMKYYEKLFTIWRKNAIRLHGGEYENGIECSKTPVRTDHFENERKLTDTTNAVRITATTVHRNALNAFKILSPV